MTIIHHYRRKFRSQTSDNMERWKSRGGKSQGGEEKKWEDQRRERVRRKKMQVRKKVGTSRFTVFFQWGGSRGSKSRLAKAAGAEPSGQMRDEKLHAVVARNRFASQNAQSTPGSDHFWKLRCRKSARRCGAKHICKSKCTKHTMFGPLLEVAMLKKCTPLWREAHFQVKSVTTEGFGPLFDVQRSWDLFTARSSCWNFGQSGRLEDRCEQRGEQQGGVWMIKSSYTWNREV